MTGTHLFSQFYTLIEICGWMRKIIKLTAHLVISLKQHRCQALLAVNFPDVCLGTFLHSYVRSWDKFLEEITGFVGNFSHCCDIFLPCYHINIVLTHGIGAWLSLILWGLFLHTLERNAYHIPFHIWSCRNMAFFQVFLTALITITKLSCYWAPLQQ